ncbi:transposase [Pelobacter seleniigenes]
MRYTRAVKVGVLPSENRSIPEVGRDIGVNDQAIRNWIKRYKSDAFDDVN